LNCLNQERFNNSGIIFDTKTDMIYDKKITTFKSPDLDKLQAVVIDLRTRIYIAVGADTEEAKKRYFARLEEKKP